MKTALLAAALASLALFFACADQTLDTSSRPTLSEAGAAEPASNCPGRCAAYSVSCGTDPAECATICVGLTEGQLSCLEDSDCSGTGATSCTDDAGLAFDAGGETGSTGECTPLNSSCLSALECCENAACTNVVGSSNMVCCLDVSATCANDQDCCSTICGDNAKCCFGSSVSCTADTAASCCSGSCGSSGTCDP